MPQTLEDAAPLYRDASEARAARALDKASVMALLSEAAPHAGPRRLRIVGDIMVGTLKAMGRALSHSEERHDEIAERTEALADMLCAYLATLRSGAI